MSEQLKAGEYVGADEIRYRLSVQKGFLHLEGDGLCSPRVQQLDLRTAAAALIALADELETEVVELTDFYRLVMRPGKDDELEFFNGPEWVEPEASMHRSIAVQLAHAAYRAGLAKAGDK